MTSACIGFSACRIQFIPNDRDRPERDYSDRSLLELRQYDFANFSLRALDIENNKEEIFAIPLENANQYRCGKGATFPDEIRGTSGTYRLWLNASSRDRFYKALNESIETIKLMSGHESSPASSASPKIDRRFDQDTSRSSARDNRDSFRSNTRDDRDSFRSNTRNDRDSHQPNARDDRNSPKFNARDDHNSFRSNTRDDRDSRQPNARDDRDSRQSNDRDDRDSFRPNTRDDRNLPKSNARDDRDSFRFNTRDDRNSPKSIARDNWDPPKPNVRGNPDPRKPNVKDDHDEQKSTEKSNLNDIVADVYQLGQSISDGATKKAIDLARKLSKQQVHLQANLTNPQTEEKKIQIRVKIDSNNRQISKQDGELAMTVYPSTTIAELRAAFQCSKNFPPSNQYFFVNGHLAYDQSSMKELNVSNDILFVLFVIQP